MRNLAMMVAMLALTGCDVDKTPPQTPRVQTPAAAQTPQNVAPQWAIQVNAKEAVSDTSAWLLERSYPPFVVNIDGKQQVMIGPYDSPEKAEQTRTELLAKLAKSHRVASPVVIEQPRL